MDRSRFSIPANTSRVYGITSSDVDLPNQIGAFPPQAKARCLWAFILGELLRRGIHPDDVDADSAARRLAYAAAFYY